MARGGTPQRALVIGPGAIGTVVAARLAQAGSEVSVASRTAKTAEHLTETGVRVEDDDGGILEAPVQGVSEPEELIDQPELVVLATKCQDAHQALTTWIGVLPDGVPVVSMQNGIMGDKLAPIAGDRFVDGVVGFPATLEDRGHSHKTGPGDLYIGAWPEGPVAGPVAQAASWLDVVAPVETTTNMEGVRWAKLLINSCTTTLGVATGETMGRMLEHAWVRRAFLHVITEGYRAGQAKGVTFERVAGLPPGLMSLPEDPGTWNRWWRERILALVGSRYKRMRSSSLQSLERGRSTEVDHLNALIVETGQAHGVPTPVNEALVEHVHRIEAGKEAPDLSATEQALASVL